MTTPIFRAFMLDPLAPPFAAQHRDATGTLIPGIQIAMRVETDEIVGYAQIANPAFPGTPGAPPTIDDPTRPLYHVIFSGSFFVPILKPANLALALNNANVQLAICRTKGQNEVDAYVASLAAGASLPIPTGKEINPVDGTILP